MIKDGLPRAAMRLLGKVSIVGDVALTTAPAGNRYPAVVFVFRCRQQGSTSWSVGAAELGLDRLSQVLEEMKAVSCKSFNLI